MCGRHPTQARNLTMRDLWRGFNDVFVRTTAFIRVSWIKFFYVDGGWRRAEIARVRRAYGTGTERDG